MTEDELQWLYETSLRMDSVVEIGSWKGRSTHALLSGCKGSVFAIDHFKGSPNELDSNHQEALEKDIYEAFYDNVGHFPNLVVMKMDSLSASRFFRYTSVDMVFIDGCHLYEDVLTDILVWKPIAKKILCGHDFDRAQGVIDTFARLKIKPKNEVDSIWSMQLWPQ